ncbi:MAG: MarR family transcriptional regulator [Candidatus Peregrinibacteria bacterium]|nr:MarR family transcriptional regulator [Candidatus Peregrinibacteria bacterium]
MKKQLVDSIISLTFELSRVVRKRMARASTQMHAMNFLQLHALLLILEYPGITMKELAVGMKITSPSATSLIERLVRSKLVRRSADTKNRKLVRLRVTPEGLKILRSAMRQKHEAVRDIIEHVPEHDLEEFARILATLLSSYKLAHGE